MAKRSLQKVECIACEKKTKPDKHHVYVLNVTWSDGVKYAIYRKNQDFNELHNDLEKIMVEFPSLEVPEPPATHRMHLLKKDSRHDKHDKRKRKMEKFCEELLTLPQIDKVREVLQAFFSVRLSDKMYTNEQNDADTSPPKSPPKEHHNTRPLSALMKQWRRGNNHTTDGRTHKKSISDPNVLQEILNNMAGVKRGSTSGSLPGSKENVADSEEEDENKYRVFVKYSMTEKFSVVAGDVIRSIERHDNGWWLVEKCSDGSQGWIPAHILATNKGMAPQQFSLLAPLAPSSRLSCSCPDIATPEMPTKKGGRIRHGSHRPKGPSDSNLKNTQSDHPSPKRPRSRTSQSDRANSLPLGHLLDEDDTYDRVQVRPPHRPRIEVHSDDSGGYATLAECAKPRRRPSNDSGGYATLAEFARPRRRPSVDDGGYESLGGDSSQPSTAYRYRRRPSTDSVGYATFGEDCSQQSANAYNPAKNYDDDYDPYSMADEDDTDIGPISEDGPYSAVSNAGQRSTPVYAQVQKKGGPSNYNPLWTDEELNDPNYESFDSLKDDDDDVDAIYAKVQKPTRRRHEKDNLDDMGSSIEHMDDFDDDCNVPELPKRSYSLSDITALFTEDQDGLSSSIKEAEDNTLMLQPMAERKVRSFTVLDDPENIYESIYPVSRSETKTRRDYVKVRRPTIKIDLPDRVVDELSTMNCYHGVMSTKVVCNTLQKYGNDGDFLIRPILSKAGELCISMKDGSNTRNFPIKYQPNGENGYHFANHAFPSITAIIKYYESKPICLSKTDKRPVRLGSAISTTNGQGDNDVDVVTFNTFL